MSRSRWIAPALWGVLIEVLTSWPRVPDVGAPGGSDKLSHLLLYGIFAFLVVRAAQPVGIARPSLRAALNTLVALTIWGAVDEWHQRFIDGRSAEVSDWLADTAGVGIGLAVALVKPRQLATKTA